MDRRVLKNKERSDLPWSRINSLIEESDRTDEISPPLATILPPKLPGVPPAELFIFLVYTCYL